MSKFERVRLDEERVSIKQLDIKLVKGMDVDKLSGDLLVVVLAILTDAIPRTLAAEVIKSWTENPGRSLVEWLKEKTGLDEARIKRTRMPGFGSFEGASERRSPQSECVECSCCHPGCVDRDRRRYAADDLGSDD